MGSFVTLTHLILVCSILAVKIIIIGIVIRVNKTYCHHHYSYHVCCNHHFHMNLGQKVRISVLFLQLYSKRTFRDQWHLFLRVGCSSCHQTSSVKALKKITGTEASQATLPTGLIPQLHKYQQCWTNCGTWYDQSADDICLSIAWSA